MFISIEIVCHRVATLCLSLWLCQSGSATCSSCSPSPHLDATQYSSTTLHCRTAQHHGFKRSALWRAGGRSPGDPRFHDKTILGRTRLGHEQVAAAVEELRQVCAAIVIGSSSIHPSIHRRLLVRSAHFTPIPAGSSPLKRDLASYIKWVL